MTIIYFLLLMTIIIVIHELGHLIAAKYFGVYCYEFSFGMGPLLFKKQGKETQYSIRALPIGGFVAMAGEEADDENYRHIQVPENRRLNNKVWWQKIIIMLAGVTMNFILAFMIFSLTVLANGQYALSPKAEVGSVVANSPAEKAGLMEGDVIIEIAKKDGESKKPKTYEDMQTFFLGYGDVETYVIERNGEQLTFEIQPEFNEESQSYLIGIESNAPEVVEVNALNCWKYGILRMFSMTKMMLQTIGTLLKGQGLNQLSGPVGIYQATGEYVKYGFGVFAQLIGMLSLNIGIFNLLPLPVLDGGQVVITLVEKVIGKPLNDKFKTVVMIACWVVLIGLMLFVTWNDIMRIIGG